MVKKRPLSVSLKAINKQSSDSTDASYQSNEDPYWGQSATNRFPSVHVVLSKPLLRCSTLRACICIRLQIEYKAQEKEKARLFSWQIVKHINDLSI